MNGDPDSSSSEDQPVNDGSKKSNHFVFHNYNQPPPRQPQSMTVGDIGNLVDNKKGLYRAMAYVGQLYLPPYHLCTLGFLAQIMKKEKHSFQMFELVPVQVQSKYKKILTIEFIFSKLGEGHVARKYLPDEPEGHVTQDYLYTMINTIDCGFFPKIQGEIDRQKKAKKVAKQEVKLVLDPAMVEMLEKFADHRLGKPSVKSLAGLGQVPKKRKRKDAVNDW
jgi:hypothetical protein